MLSARETQAPQLERSLPLTTAGGKAPFTVAGGKPPAHCSWREDHRPPRLEGRPPPTAAGGKPPAHRSWRENHRPPRLEGRPPPTAAGGNPPAHRGWREAPPHRGWGEDPRSAHRGWKEAPAHRGWREAPCSPQLEEVCAQQPRAHTTKNEGISCFQSQRVSSIPLGPRTTLVSSGGYSGHHHLFRKQSPPGPRVSLVAIHPEGCRPALRLPASTSPFPYMSLSTLLSLLWRFYPNSFYRVARCQVGFPGGSDRKESV